MSPNVPDGTYVYMASQCSTAVICITMVCADSDVPSHFNADGKKEFYDLGIG
jgi:hypothetical protein